MNAITSRSPETERVQARSLPPGPRLPVALQTARVWRATVAFLDAASRRHGPVFTIRARPWGAAVVVNDRRLVREVLWGDPAVYHTDEGGPTLAPLVGWPPLLASYAGVVEQIVAEEVTCWPLLEAFPLHARFRALTLAVRENARMCLLVGDEDDDQVLREQIMKLLIAGQETSSAGLAWTFERLLRHPATLARAREGEDAYLDAIVQESLRVRPPAPVVLRQLRAPVSLGGHELPAGITLMAAIKPMYCDPALFSQPHRFKPERFLDGEGGTYEWIPCAGGRRHCLGGALASLGMRVAIRTILQATELRAADPADERVHNHHMTLVPARGARTERVGWRALAGASNRVTLHARLGARVGARA